MLKSRLTIIHSRHDHGKNSSSTAYLVKEEKLALDLLEQIKNGADSASWRRNTLFARQANAAVIW